MYQSSSCRKHFLIDTAALCDVAFLLLCFFILNWQRTNFYDPVRVNVPLSPYTGCVLPEGGPAGIIVIAQHKVMFSIFPPDIRRQTLKQIGQSYHLSFSPGQLSGFAKMDYVGSTVYALKNRLNRPDAQSDSAIITQTGIPVEQGNNDLANWIYESKKANALVSSSPIRFYIKADEKTEYQLIKKVIRTLQNQGIHKFSLLTNLKQTNYE